MILIVDVLLLMDSPVRRCDFRLHAPDWLKCRSNGSLIKTDVGGNSVHLGIGASRDGSSVGVCCWRQTVGGGGGQR